MAEVAEGTCCPGKTTNHMGKGRCASKQGGRTAEAEVKLTRESTDVLTVDGVEYPVFPFDPMLVSMNCVSMVDCMMSTDSCGEQIPASPYGIRHLMEDPTDPTMVYFHVTDVNGSVESLPEETYFYLRFYGA